MNRFSPSDMPEMTLGKGLPILLECRPPNQITRLGGTNPEILAILARIPSSLSSPFTH